MEITKNQVAALVAPYGNKAIISNTATAFNQYSEEFGLNTPLRVAHFMAQIAHESDHFKTTVEYGGSKKRYAPWYGRGLIQTTWEDNYKAFNKWCQDRGLETPDFTSVDGREQVSRFPWAFLCAIWYWQTHHLNALADKDDVKAITKAINGGYNGLDERTKLLNKAKKIFGSNDSQSSDSSDSYTVEDVQNALIANGYRITADGVSGPQTIAAIKMFQKTNGLTADGVVGPQTASVLFR